MIYVNLFKILKIKAMKKNRFKKRKNVNQIQILVLFLANEKLENLWLKLNLKKKWFKSFFYDSVSSKMKLNLH